MEIVGQFIQRLGASHEGAVLGSLVDHLFPSVEIVDSRSWFRERIASKTVSTSSRQELARSNRFQRPKKFIHRHTAQSAVDR